MNPLGKLPESTAVAGKMDFVGLMKVLRVALLAGGAAVLGVFITMLPGLDFLPESTIDTTIITLLSYLDLKQFDAGLLIIPPHRSKADHASGALASIHPLAVLVAPRVRRKFDRDFLTI